MADPGEGRQLRVDDLLYRKVNAGEYDDEAIDPTAFIDKYPRQSLYLARVASPAQALASAESTDILGVGTAPGSAGVPARMPGPKRAGRPRSQGDHGACPRISAGMALAIPISLEQLHGASGCRPSDCPGQREAAARTPRHPPYP